MEVAGDVISFRTFGQVVVVLNTANAAKDLLEKRSEIYSDRSINFTKPNSYFSYVSDHCL